MVFTIWLQYENCCFFKRFNKLTCEKNSNLNGFHHEGAKNRDQKIKVSGDEVYLKKKVKKKYFF